jgi:hypothetical protein
LGGSAFTVIRPAATAGFVAEFACPIIALQSMFAGYAFMDDTDLVVAKLSFSSYQDAALQQAMTLWEQGLNATSGAIVPKRMYLFLIDFTWNYGRWACKSFADSPASFSVKDKTQTLKLWCILLMSTRRSKLWVSSLPLTVT